MSYVSQRTPAISACDELDLIWGTIASCESLDDDGETVMLDEEDISFLERQGIDDGSLQRRRYDSLGEELEFSYRDEGCSTNIPTFAEIFGRLTRVSSDEESMTTDGMDISGSSDSDYDEKPAGKSRRGAKNVLLWKFLLQMLDQRPDLAAWIDRKKGLFKFVDTNALSKMWGEKKQRHDMNFEKLSRGIRHYYKSGLMTRKEGTRLVYQFNWDLVPKEFQK